MPGSSGASRGAAAFARPPVALGFLLPEGRSFFVVVDVCLFKAQLAASSGFEDSLKRGFVGLDQKNNLRTRC